VEEVFAAAVWHVKLKKFGSCFSLIFCREKNILKICLFYRGRGREKDVERKRWRERSREKEEERKR
jgi:hypothetical protein